MPAVQMLDQNFEYIKVIADHQKRGLTAEANMYSHRLKDSLALLAKQSEKQASADMNQVSPFALFVRGRHPHDCASVNVCKLSVQVYARAYGKAAGKPVAGVSHPGPCPVNLVSMQAPTSRPASANMSPAKALAATGQLSRGQHQGQAGAGVDVVRAGPLTGTPVAGAAQQLQQQHQRMQLQQQQQQQQQQRQQQLGGW